MALTPATWITTLMGEMSSRGFVGADLIKFVTAVANGSVLSLIGKSFATVDSGTVPGVGAGTGVGLSGVTPGSVSSVILSTGAGLGLLGSKFPDVCDAVEAALITELANATLVSTHTPVFLGAGIVAPGSIVVPAIEVQGNISDAGLAAGLLGTDFVKICTAIGAGYQAGMALATGNVVIAGSPTGVPVPGAGAGIGTIS